MVRAIVAYMEPNNKRIRLFCAITLGEMGGAQQFIQQLTGNLDPAWFEITVVTGSDGRRDLAAHLPKHVTWQVVPRLVRSISLVNDLAAIRSMRHMMAEFEPDIVLLNSSKAGFVGALAARKLPNVRVVYRIGGWSFNDPRPTWERWLYRQLERFSARYKDVIVVNSAHDLAQARQYNIKPRGPVVCIHNGIDPYHELLNRTDARRELIDRIEQTSNHRPELRVAAGIIANFYPTKGLDVLLEAATKTPNVQYIVIGDGPQREQLEQQIAKLGLEQRVFLCGRVPDARRYLHAFDLVVLPSVKEGFPWTILEAMAAKVPIVATTVGAVPEALEDGRSALLVPPGDPTALADAIGQILESERLRQDLVIRAHQELLAHFTLREMVEKYKKLFRQLVGQ